MKSILSPDYVPETAFDRYHREARERDKKINSLRPKLVMDIGNDPRYDV